MCWHFAWNSCKRWCYDEIWALIKWKTKNYADATSYRTQLDGIQTRCHQCSSIKQITCEAQTCNGVAIQRATFQFSLLVPERARFSWRYTFRIYVFITFGDPSAPCTSHTFFTHRRRFIAIDSQLTWARRNLSGALSNVRIAPLCHHPEHSRSINNRGLIRKLPILKLWKLEERFDEIKTDCPLSLSLPRSLSLPVPPSLLCAYLPTGRGLLFIEFSIFILRLVCQRSHWVILSESHIWQ